MSNRYDDNGFEILDPSDCIQFGEGCGGEVEYRMPLSGTGRSFVRCDTHWDERLDTEAGIRERYPSTQPSDFDPYYAGESWY